jgi:hypothetical protein
VLNPIGKDDYTLTTMGLFCNKLGKFTPVLTTKRMNIFLISDFKINVYHNLNDFQHVFLKNSKHNFDELLTGLHRYFDQNWAASKNHKQMIINNPHMSNNKVTNWRTNLKYATYLFVQAWLEKKLENFT